MGALAGKSEQEIRLILEAGKSPRCQRIETYQRYWDGTIYEGRVPFLDTTIDTPILNRAPCVVYPITRSAISAITSMAMGLGKFPDILSMTGEDDTSFDERFGLDTEESVVLDAAVKNIIEQTRLESGALQLCETALHSGTCVAVVCIHGGRLVVSQLDPKYCTPVFDPQAGERVVSVEICYRYVVDFWAPTEQKWLKKVMQYRRVIDEKSDTTYKPVEVENASHFPTPGTPDKDKTYAHGFGFCPVIWYAHRASGMDASDIDGKPIHWGLTSQLDALNFAYSQRHRAALYAGDPQYYEIGVDPDVDIQATGQAAVIAQTTAANPSGRPMNGGWAFGTGGRGGPARRKKGPGVVWQTRNADAKIGMLTLPGDALKAIDEHAEDLRKKVAEAFGWVSIDPSQLKGAGDISGKTLAFIFSQQVATCNALREDFGRRCLLPLMNLIYRVILASSKNAKGALYLAGLEELRKVLEKFAAPVGEEASIKWFEPAQKLVWGPYFEPSDVDEATRTATAMQTWQAGGIQLSTAVQHVADIFGIRNVDQYVEQLKQENEEKAQQEIDRAGQMAQSTGKMDGMSGKAGKGPFAKIDEPSAQAESASSNPTPKRKSPETRAWRKPSKLD